MPMETAASGIVGQLIKAAMAFSWFRDNFSPCPVIWYHL
jgi:hypothetical protein